MKSDLDSSRKATEHEKDLTNILNEKYLTRNLNDLYDLYLYKIIRSLDRITLFFNIKSLTCSEPEKNNLKLRPFTLIIQKFIYHPLYHLRGELQFLLCNFEKGIQL